MTGREQGKSWRPLLCLWYAALLWAPGGMEVAEYPKKRARRLVGHKGAVLKVRFNRAGTYCMSGGQDRIVRLWNPHKDSSDERTNLVNEYHGHSYEVRGIDIVHDNSQFASCGGDRVVYVWDVVSSRIRVKLRGHEGKVNAVAYSEDGSVLVSGGYDKKVALWDLLAKSREPMQSMEDASDSISAVCVHGHEIIAASVDGCVRTYDVRMGKVHTDTLHAGVTAMQVSGDGNCLLVGCMDSTVKLIDRATGELLNKYRGHKSLDYAVGCTMTNDDAYVLAGSEDGAVYVWDLVDCRIVARLKSHRVVVSDVAYHPSQTMLVSGAVDGTIQVWS